MTENTANQHSFMTLPLLFEFELRTISPVPETCDGICALNTVPAPQMYDEF
jgi:hypothetical protein